MRRILWVLFILGSAVASSSAPTAQVFERTLTRTVGYHYWLNLPAGYQAGGGKRWPILLFLHGSGEAGSDLTVIARQGIPKLLTESAAPTNNREREARDLVRERFIVVAPQCPKNARWDDEAVLALLEEVIGKYAGDPARVYLTGVSLGGYGTWAIGLRHPERFAALVPICGGGSWDDVNPERGLAGLAIWAFHGADDGLVPSDESTRMIAAVRSAGIEEAKLTIYPETQHDSWTRTYSDPDLYRWLLWQHR